MRKIPVKECRDGEHPNEIECCGNYNSKPTPAHPDHPKTPQVQNNERQAARKINPVCIFTLLRRLISGVKPMNGRFEFKLHFYRVDLRPVLDWVKHSAIAALSPMASLASRSSHVSTSVTLRKQCVQNLRCDSPHPDRLFQSFGQFSSWQFAISFI